MATIYENTFLKYLCLAGVAQLVGGPPMNQKVGGSIPSQGTDPDCRFNPWSEGIQEATD